MKKFWILLGLVLNVFWLAPMSVSAEGEEPPTTVIEEATYYQLDSAEDLKWFADQVNGGNTSIHAILTADITLNSNVLAEDGSLNGDGSGFSVWTPIGRTNDVMYEGVFDGAGHTIRGLYYNDATKTDDKVNYYIGLFGQTKGIVKNTTLADSYLNAYANVAGIAGICEGSVMNCHNEATIRGKTSVAGIVGQSRTGFHEISNCSNRGAVSGESLAGGILGGAANYNGRASIINCYNLGTISCNNNSGGIVGFEFTGNDMTNCYNAGKIVIQGEAKEVGGLIGRLVGNITNCYNIGVMEFDENYVWKHCGSIAGYVWDTGNLYKTYNLSGPPSDYGGSFGHLNTFEVKSMDPEAYASGEAAYIMNQAYGSDFWYQNLDNGKSVDAIPVFDNTHGIVYATNINCTQKRYSNTQGEHCYDHGDFSYSDYYSNSEKAPYIRVKCGFCYNSGYFYLKSPEDLIYDGSAKEATLKTTGTSVCSIPEIAYEGERTNAGGSCTARVTMGDCTISIDFTVEPRSLSGAQILIEDAVHNGETLEPVPTVTLDGVSLVHGTDFTCSYTNNVDCGTAEVTVKGIGNYKNSVSANFKILDRTAPSASIKIEEDFWNTLLHNVTFGFFYKDTADATITASDNEGGVGLKEVSYLLTDTELEAEDFETAPWILLSEQTIEMDEQENVTYTVTIPSVSKTVLYVQVEDNAGNIAVINTDGVVVYKNSEASSTEDPNALEETFTYKETKDTDVLVVLNENTVKAVSCEGSFLTEGTDYIVVDDVITLTAEYLDTLDARETAYEFTVYYNPAGVETDKVEITTNFKIKINKAKITITSVTTEEKKYDKTTAVQVTGAVLDGVKTGDEVSLDCSSVVAEVSDANVGEYEKAALSYIALTGDDAHNYDIDASTVVDTFAVIKKADALSLEDKVVSAGFTDTKIVIRDVGNVMPIDAGSLSYGGSETNWSVNDKGKLTILNKNGVTGDIITCPVIISSLNYEDSILNVVVTLNEKVVTKHEVDYKDISISDEDDLIKNKEELEELLEENADRYTDKEKKAIEKEIKRIDKALQEIRILIKIKDQKNAQKALEEQQKNAVPLTNDTSNVEGWSIVLMMSAVVILTAGRRIRRLSSK